MKSNMDMYSSFFLGVYKIKPISYIYQQFSNRINKFYRGISDGKIHGFRNFTQFDHLFQSLAAENIVTNRDVREKKKLELNTLHLIFNLKH